MLCATAHGQIILGNQAAVVNAILAYNTNWLNFGTNLSGATNDMTVWITNVGTTVLSGSPSTASPFSVVAPASYSMGTNDATNIVVRYTRSGAANDTNELALTGGQCTTNIHLSGYSTNAPSSGWHPTNIATILAYWDSDVVVKDGSSYVTNWTDQWANAYHLTNRAAGTIPLSVDSVINGKSAVLFDGANDFVRSAAYTQTQPDELVVLVINTNNAGTESLIADGAGSSTRQKAFANTGPSAPALGAGTDMTANNAYMNTNIAHLIGYAYSGTASQVWTNMGSIVQTGDGNTGGASGITIGTKYTGTSPFSGYVLMIAAFSNTNTFLNRSNIYWYCTNKYAIHP